MTAMWIEVAAGVLAALSSAPATPPVPARPASCSERAAASIADCCARPGDARPTLNLPDPFHSAPLPVAASTNHERTPGDADIR
jgi:hypothetical protein